MAALSKKEIKLANAKVRIQECIDEFKSTCSRKTILSIASDSNQNISHKAVVEIFDQLWKD